MHSSRPEHALAEWCLPALFTCAFRWIFSANVAYQRSGHSGRRSMHSAASVFKFVPCKIQLQSHCKCPCLHYQHTCSQHRKQHCRHEDSNPRCRPPLAELLQRSEQRSLGPLTSRQYYAIHLHALLQKPIWPILLCCCLQVLAYQALAAISTTAKASQYYCFKVEALGFRFGIIGIQASASCKGSGVLDGGLRR